MVLMLAVLYMLWDRARDPSLWRWLADDPAAGEIAESDGASTPESGAPASAARLDRTGHVENVPHAGTDAGEAAAKGKGAPQPPAATGPTDEDPEEQTAIQEEFQAITDKTLEVKPVEMFAYKRVLQWVVNQPMSVMRKRARTDLSFHDLMTSPDKCRGALVELKLNVRLIRSVDFRASDGSDLYEVWGFTTESGSWLYSGLVVGLPEGMPIGTRISEQVRFVGYFFKLLGYHEANAKPHAPPLVAPMLLGRLIWIQAPPPAPSSWNASWAIAIVAGFALIVVLQLAWLFLKPKRRRSSMKAIGGPSPGAIRGDEWFERAEEGIAPIADDSPESRPPSDPVNLGGGNGKGARELFSHPLDGDVEGGG